MAEPKISALCLTHVWVINRSEVKQLSSFDQNMRNL